MRHGRFGLGPVFAFEWLVLARRWQWYALRSVFAGLLLTALVVVLLDTNRYGRELDIRGLARLGQTFYIAVMAIQITLVLLAAPAATAGAIAQDRASGMMTHLLVTDLSDPEIVLGKLVARLVPVLGLVACALPILAIMTLLGGVDPLALAGGFVVTLGLAILGTALAFCFSLWSPKTHEALLGTYAVWAIWLLGPDMVRLLNKAASWNLSIPVLLANPYQLAFAPYWEPTKVTARDYGWFLATTIGLAAGLTGLTIARIRAVCTRTRVKRQVSRRGLIGRLDRRLNWRFPLPSPSLDFNPVLWREWHRSRPSRLTRIVIGVYMVGSLLASIAAILSTGPFTRVWVNGLQTAIGMLLLSVIASTSLAEERVRGGLDILMTTPLSTAEIVIGKWLGTFRLAGWLAIFPVLLVVCGDPSNEIYLPAVGLTVAFEFIGAGLIAALGLLMATWCQRPGRAVALTVTIYLLVTVGLAPIIMSLIRVTTSELFLMCSPFFYGGIMAGAVSRGDGPPSPIGWAVFWSLTYLIVTALLLGLTLLTFNRCLGRAGGSGLPRLSGPDQRPTWAGWGRRRTRIREQSASAGSGR